MTSTPTLEFTVSTEPDGTTVLHERGEVDLATAAVLRERLLAQFASCDRLVVDLSRAMLYDGPALRALRALHHEAEHAGRETPVLRGVRPMLAKALKAACMDALFPREDHVPFVMPRVARPRPSRHARPRPRAGPLPGLG